MTAAVTQRRNDPLDRYSNGTWAEILPPRWQTRRLRTVVEMRVSNVDKHTNEDEIPVRLCNYVDVYYNDHIDGNLPYMMATVSPDEADRFRLKRNDVVITKDSEAWTTSPCQPSSQRTGRLDLRVPLSHPATIWRH